MYIKAIRLKNFRNFPVAKLELGPRFNLITGANAQGKTNIVESFGLLGTGKSFRTQEFRDMIRWGEDQAEVFARASIATGEDDLSVFLDLNKKSFFKNSKNTNVAGMAKASAVIFAPEEILLLKDSPSGRRHYMDRVISCAEPAYHVLIRRYERVVSHRNKLLQDEASDAQKTRNLEEWNAQLGELGAKVVMMRSKICERINGVLPLKYKSVAPKDSEARFVYKPHCGDEFIAGGEGVVGKRLKAQLEERRRDEFLRCVTLVGPHRDDFEAAVGGSALKHFGSQGQHRTFVLALKLAEIEIFRSTSGETPILLLDDVASELDAERCRLFFKHLMEEECQVLITATEENPNFFGEGKETKRFKVENRQVTSV